MVKVTILALALAGCNSVGLTSSFCDPRSGIEPIRPDATEIAALRTETKRRILAVNNFGKTNCGWKP